jgi:hypothetical protein
MRLLACITLGVTLAVGSVSAQTETNTPPPELPPAPPPEGTNQVAAPKVEVTEKRWSFSASAYTYLIKDDHDYVVPIVTADRDWFHLEARYNYEAPDTASVWVGYNMSFGDKLSLELTPMLGGVFGDTSGIAPGYRATLGFKRLELYTEGEYLFDSKDSSEDFFYTWSELTFALTDWLRVGAVIQRTKLYETESDIQRGFLVGVSLKRMSLTTYVFEPGDDATYVFAVGFGF